MSYQSVPCRAVGLMIGPRDSRGLRRGVSNFLGSDAVAELIGKGEVVLGDVRHGKYAGRVVARVVLPDGKDVGEELLGRGLARAYDGRGARQVWCRAGE